MIRRNPNWLLMAAGLVLALALAGCAAQDAEIDRSRLSDTPLHGKFVWHDLITDDVDAAKAFYGELFGWTFRDTRGLDGRPYSLIVTHGGRIMGGIVGVPDPDSGEDYSRWLGYVSVDDVDQAVATAERLDGQVVVAPREISDIARAAVIIDSQEAVVGFLDSHIGDPRDGVAVAPGDIVLNELLAANSLAAAAFYMETAGYEVTTEWRHGGEYHTLERGGVARAGLQDIPNDQVKPLWLTHFAVTDPAAMARKAAALGGEVVLAPTADVRDGNLAIVIDPAGAVLALDRINP